MDPDLRHFPTGFSPPVRRSSPLNPHKVVLPLDQRRRPWPSDAPLSPSERHRRTMSRSESSTRTSQTVDTDPGAFSNEYDLSHEDPRILQEVQRALQMKARREARLKRESAQDSTQPDPSPPSSPVVPQTPPHKHTTSLFSRSPSSDRKHSNSTASDLDFSPMTAGNVDAPAALHPVPTSLDSGITLDWSGGGHDEGDKRWSKLPGRRKEKDKVPPLGIILEQQEHVHKEKLAKISGLLSSQTQRKAKMISDQLGRQYKILFSELNSSLKPVNVVSAAHWYSMQDPRFKASIEANEPLTWLRHLKRRSDAPPRSPWLISALVLEEYFHSHSNIQTIPEGSTVDSTSPLTTYTIPSSLSPSRLQTHSHDRLSHPALLHEEPISFEPKRRSLDAQSHRSAESALSSAYSGSPSATGPLPLPHITNRLEEMARTSLSPSADALSLQSFPTSGNTTLVVPEVVIQAPSESTVLTNPTPIAASQSASTEISGSSPTRQSFSSLKNSIKQRPLQTAFPFNEHLNKPKKKKKKITVEDRETMLRREYEQKTRLLQDAEAHNHRMRLLIHRLAATVKDYDAIQADSFERLGIVQPRIPKDLIDAFAHDPSTVIGHARRKKSYQAVEDVHARLQRQRTVFKESSKLLPKPGARQDCFLDDPITEISQALETLEEFKAQVVDQADTMRERLKEVQQLHGDVKESYNNAVSVVSVEYPQLSHIVALEEDYRDQYQQIWDIGMDALTLLLDTVTPVWRTYGKSIGEDVRDFLIIPLYRNEFTGEAKRYPIMELPRRSFQHWLGLVFVFCLSIGINILQARAAVSSTRNCFLYVIPYDGVRWTAMPFFWLGILIQWLAVIVEFAIVFTEIGTLAWWIGWFLKVFS